MRLGSETAYRTALDSWDALMEAKGAGEFDFAQELFSIADMLDGAPALTAALEDAARSADDRAKLISDVLASKVSGEVKDLLSGLVREHWSESGDLIRAVEALGVQTLLVGSSRENQLDRVESELYSVKDVLAQQRDLRTTLTNETYTVASRQQLAAQVFPDLTSYTHAFVNRALEQAHKRSVRISLERYLDAAGERASHLVASVTAALPLTAEQEQRLTNVLASKYGTDVRLHTTIDTSVIGGVKVLIGSDVIDGTIASRLAKVKEVFSNGR